MSTYTAYVNLTYVKLYTTHVKLYNLTYVNIYILC